MLRPVVLCLVLLVPAVAHAQAWRSSILCAPEGDALSAYGFGGGEGDEVAASSDATADSAMASPSSPDSARVPSAAPPPVVRPQKQPAILFPILIGAAAGAGGGLLGALAGNAQDPGYDEISGGLILGYLIGESVLLAAGVHVGNRAHGNILADLGTSIVMQIAAIGLSGAGDQEYLLGLASQLALTVVVEREAGRKKLAKEAAAAGAR
jgi:hypothetical protein